MGLPRSATTSGRATFASSAVAAALSRSATRSCSHQATRDYRAATQGAAPVQIGVYSNTDGKVLVFPVENSHPRYAKGYQVDVRPYFGVAPTAATKPAAPVVTPADHAKVGGAVVATTAAAGAAAASSQRHYRNPNPPLDRRPDGRRRRSFHHRISYHQRTLAVDTSTGKVSQEVSPLSLQPSAKSLGAGFGPVGTVIGGLAGEAIAAAFGTDPTPEAVGKAIAEDPAAAESSSSSSKTAGRNPRPSANQNRRAEAGHWHNSRFRADDTDRAASSTSSWRTLTRRCLGVLLFWRPSSRWRSSWCSRSFS